MNLMSVKMLMSSLLLLITATIFGQPTRQLRNDVSAAVKSIVRPGEAADKMMKRLARNPNMPFADSIVKAVAYSDPDLVYDHASAGNAFSRKIQAHPDPLVKTIAQLAVTKGGRLYFPFLDELYRGVQTLESIAPAIDNEAAYFKLLVTTQVNYAGRMANNDIPVLHEAVAIKLKQRAIECYVNDINGLHNSPDNIRFRKLQALTPVELYYVAVMGADDIYTSSYLGLYKRLFEKLKVPGAGDTLLSAVHYDHFRKWIKLAAGYNTLNDFLGKMDPATATLLMKDMVKGLDKTASLEAAVDAADCYASISDPKLQQLLLDEVQANLSSAKTPRSKHIYQLLNTIFLSKDPANRDITATLGIRPVFNMPIASLKDTGGRIIIEQFIYGDEIGPGDFAAFLKTFRNANWKIIDKKEWVEIVSLKGEKVMIFANKPLDEKKNLDGLAQQHLNEYLEQNGLYPTIAIHRGHSYNARYTIEQLPSSSKVVLLGSCGGYQNLNDVLKACPQAHIIATKQMGTAIVTQPMINLMADKLRAGEDLQWPEIWKQLEARFTDKTSKDRFEDYVPPHRNLGAIFMNAYNVLEQKGAVSRQ
jgi:hypothetical protein